MIRKTLTATAIAVMLGSAGAADYCFPSPINPAGKAPGELTQYISIIWDDNAYSGLDGTTYEADSGTIEWKDGNCVGGQAGLATHGFPSWVPNKNVLNIEEGDMGMAWAIQLGVPMTFNMITGLYVPTSNPANSPDIDGDGVADGWANRESPLGFWKPNSADQSAGMVHTRIAVSWGREMEITDGGQKIQPNCATIVTNQALQLKHEIGNHTIDHMESNSPLPNNDKGFGRWGGEGFDTSEKDTMPWGEVINEAQEFGQLPGQSAQFMGWKVYAGRYVSKDAWGGAIELAEEWLLAQTNVKKGSLYGFRAPRLEVSSGLYLALAEQGYQYDCGLEEGYEDHRDGKNFLWPYTMDNGAQNTWTQYNVGERRTLFEMPDEGGLWQIPVNTLIVPEDIRESVWANHEKVQLGEGYSQGYIDEAKPFWMETGKVTGFDFNTYILWGMTGPNWTKTMKNTVDLRLAGNKAPLHYGAHTDYYTPIYDFQTLLTDFNKGNFGLCVVNNWNTWETRKSTLEEFISWSQGKGCKFVTGHELIEEVKKLASEAPAKGEEVSINPTFTLYKNENLSNKTTANKETFKGGTNIEISVAAPEGSEYPFAAYRTNLTAEEITHISLDYQVTKGALAVRLILDGEPNREVLLNNVNSEDMVNAGLIPISAFDYNKYEDPANVTYDPINFNNLIAIEIQPLAPVNKMDGSYSARTEPFDMTFKIDNFKVYGKKIGISVLNNSVVAAGKLGIQSVTQKTLNLNIPTAGTYAVEIVGANGRVLRSFDKKNLAVGTQSFKLDNLSQGLYVMNVTSNDKTLSQKFTIK